MKMYGGSYYEQTPQLKWLKRIVCVIMWVILLPFRSLISVIALLFLPLIAVVTTIMALHEWACQDIGRYPNFEPLTCFVISFFFKFLLLGDWHAIVP